MICIMREELEERVQNEVSRIGIIIPRKEWPVPHVAQEGGIALR